ncbi:MAG: hypothetical protein AAF682_29410 [Planctomycetota bacterium]
MSRASLNALRVLLVLLLAGIAHGPLLGADYRAEDLALLQRAANGGGPPRAEVVAWRELSLDDVARIDPEGSLVGNAEHALRARRAPWRGGEHSALDARIEGVLLLFGIALGLGLFLRRALLPWTGSDHAGAAGWAVVPLLVAHPLTVGLVAPLRGRDELLGLLFASWAAALFLQGRQDRRFAVTAAAWTLCALASLSGEVAWLLPILLAGVELASSHRYRTRRERWRTAANTLLFFGLASGLGAAFWARRAGSRYTDGLAAAIEDPAAAASGLFERLGGVVLPANPHVSGLFGVVLAGAVFLVALQPALVAARSAPRLWGWMLGSWFVCLAGALVYGLDVRVAPDEATEGALLAGAVAVAAAGLATTATALSGLRRDWLAWLAAAVFAGLSFSNALPWREAGHVARELRADLEAARVTHGNEPRLLVLDAVRDARGIDPFGGAVGALVHPLLRPGGEAPGGGPIGEVLLLSREAFLALAREPELRRLREERSVVMLATLPGGEPVRPGGLRQAVRLAPASAAGTKRSWRGEMRSPDLDLDTLSMSTLLLTADLRSDTSGERRLHWRVTEPALANGSQRCVWVETGDEPVLVADLGRSLAWLLGDRVRRVWLEGGATSVGQARFLTAPEPLGERFGPTPDGDDWLFPRTLTPLVQATLQRGRYVLTLLSLGDYACVELPVEVLGADHLRARGAAAEVAGLRRPVAWTLDYRVEDATLARARGRRVGRDGTVEERQ